MSELSVEPRLAKAILASAGELACSQEVVTIVAMLSVHSVWTGARGERKAQNEAKMRSESVTLYRFKAPIVFQPLIHAVVRVRPSVCMCVSALTVHEMLHNCSR